MKTPLITADEVARTLNVKVSTVYDAVARGHLPAVRLWRGRRRTLIRFRSEDIDALIEKQTALADKK